MRLQKKAKWAAVSGALLLALTNSSLAGAAVEVWGESLGAGNTVDYYRLTCASAGGKRTASVAIQVNAVSAAPLTAIIRKNGDTAKQDATAVALDVTADGAYSAPASATPTPTACAGTTGTLTALWQALLNQSSGAACATNNGVYDVYVTKGTDAAAIYNLSAACMSGVDGTGVETATSISAPLQNQ